MAQRLVAADKYDVAGAYRAGPGLKNFAGKCSVIAQIRNVDQAGFPAETLDGEHLDGFQGPINVLGRIAMGEIMGTVIFENGGTEGKFRFRKFLEGELRSETPMRLNKHRQIDDAIVIEKSHGSCPIFRRARRCARLPMLC